MVFEIVNERGAGGNKPVVSPKFFDSMKELIIFIGMWFGVLIIGLIINKFDNKSKKWDWYE